MNDYTQVDTEDFNELIIALGIAEISPETIVGNMRMMIANPVKGGIGVKAKEWNEIADMFELRRITATEAVNQIKTIVE